VTLLAALAVPAQLAAQGATKQLHYKLIDLGTLGGPHSYGSINGDGFQLLNNSGIVASYADTSVPDPNAPNLCFDPSCFVAHAFRWNDGVMTDLGALYSGMNSSAGGSINSRGWVTGQSLNGITDPVLSSPEYRAVLWKGNEIVDLGTLGGHSFVIGIHVNDSGQVVGISDMASLIHSPFSASRYSFGHSSGRTERFETSAAWVARTPFLVPVAAVNLTMWLWELPTRVSHRMLPREFRRSTRFSGRAGK
jgi:hypothetical protein